MHPEAQYDGLVGAFSDLQKRLASPEWDAEEVSLYPPFSDVAITRETDAKLFIKLYRSINNLNAYEVGASTVLRLAAFPMVKEMVESIPGMEAALRECFADMERYGTPVTERIARSLEDLFKLGYIAQSQQPAFKN